MYSQKILQIITVFLIGVLFSNAALANPHKVNTHHGMHVKNIKNVENEGYKLAPPTHPLDINLSDGEDHCSKYPCYNETELESLPDAHEELHEMYLSKRQRGAARRKGPKGWTSAGKFRTQMLKYHNQYRAAHGVPPLKWSTKLAKYALANVKTCVFGHSDPYKYGENLAGGTMDNPAFYVWLWYKEVKLYNYKKPGYAHATGHFTQLVWKESTTLGCAFVAGCPGGLAQIIVCEYTPNGNISPAIWYKMNVPPVQKPHIVPPIPEKYT